MRVIGGSRAGRRIEAPVGMDTRPTSDRVREAVFNRLAHAAFDHLRGDDAGEPLAGATLDLFAGSGGLGIEALSRGAPSCDFVDAGAAACAAIRRNLAALQLDGRVHQSSVEAFLKHGKGPYRLVFADPPYADAGGKLARALARLPPLLAEDALVVVEHGGNEAPGELAGLRLLDRRGYGQTVVSFFAPAARGI